MANTSLCECGHSIHAHSKFGSHKCEVRDQLGAVGPDPSDDASERCACQGFRLATPPTARTMAPASHIADLIARSILADVTDRRGWRQEYDQFDAEVCEEINATWRRKITEILKAQGMI